jgi:ribosomal protein S18 acetylase RimI-like enzyme
MPKLVPYTHSSLKSLIDLWNRVFARYRHFHRIHEREFHDRIVSQEAFDPEGLILALHEGRVVGMVHALGPAPPSHFVYRENTCARNGSIAVIAVDEQYRRRGIGSALLRRAEAYLTALQEGGSRIHAGGYWVPLYHTLEGPRQPLWGDSEIIGISERNGACRSFFLKHRYREVEDEGQEITMTAALGRRSEPRKPQLAALGLREVRLNQNTPWRGRILHYPSEHIGYGYERFGPYRWEAVVLVRDDTITSQLEWYPMREDDNVALWDLRVGEDDRGRGLGSYLLDRALYTMSLDYGNVELHTNTDRNARAVAMYRRRGFRIAEKWVGYIKEVQ